MDATARPPTQPSSISTRNYAAFGMIGGSFIGVIALTSPFIFMQLRSPLPYMATPIHKIERALLFISRRMDARGAGSSNMLEAAKSMTSQKCDMQQPERNKRGNKLNFVDLGSGDGTAVFTAASLNWYATGMELNPTLWLISSLRRWGLSKEARMNCKLIYADMFDASQTTTHKSLREANCVMIFGVAPLMPQIAELIQSNCQPRSFVMAYRFRVPLMNLNECRRDKVGKEDVAGRIVSVASGEESTVEGVQSTGINGRLIYEEEEMRIYELTDGNKSHL
mmetsp:Transcript_1299/g.2742  ORF Transcript_1299/g.2742 Transcript_1299/m.2742 type:complete len:280 (-) Transcript_1299:1117-1956(-)